MRRSGGIGRRAGLLALGLALLTLPAAAQEQASLAPASLLPEKLAPPACPCEADLVAAQGFPADQVGYVLFDPATGAIAAAVNLDQTFIPASTLKIPAMLMGLQVLGGDYRFQTSLLGTAPIDKGVLKGDLYLKGGGDPFLTGDDLKNFVLALKAQGLTKVEGDFYYDESALPHVTELNALQPVAVPYNPGLSALSVNFNVVELNWTRGSDGLPAGLALSRSDTLDVPADAVSFSTQSSPLGKTFPYVLDRSADGERWLLSPDLPKKGEARLPVRNAALNAAALFRRLAEEQGIAVPAPQAGLAPAQAPLLLTHDSVSLQAGAKLVLRYSNNLAAELVGLAAALRLAPADQPVGGDLSQSGSTLAAWLNLRLPRTDWSGFHAANASGLSADSRMTPRQMMAILTEAFATRSADLDLYQLLAPVRWSDELQEGRDDDAPELVVRAKSGTIYYSRALAGYMLTDSGRFLGFALFVTDAQARAAYDASLNRDETAEAPGAKAWMKRAKTLEKALVTRWVTQY